MAKKRESKKSIKKTISKKTTKIEIEQALIDNFVNLQKVLTNLTVKFDDLSSNITKLLQLFEISAKNFAEKFSDGYEDRQSKVDKDFLVKLDSLLDQNKTISKGIMLMEEKIRGGGPPSIREEPDTRFSGMVRSKPLPKYQWE